MAVTVSDLQVASHGFSLTASSADATGCEVLKAAPGAGISLVLEKVMVSVGTGQTVTIGEGETASAVDAPIFEVVLAGNRSYTHKFDRPIILTANKALTVDSSASGAIRVSAEGYIK